MGAESSILQGCKLEEPLETPSCSDWRLHPAKRKDGSRVSVFVHKKSEQEDKRLENAAKQLKILRHPTILKFFASCDNVEGTYLITEQVRPLELVLDTLTPEEICAGLYNVAEALSFLHDRGGASHNNVCLSSIYVSCQDGGWRLGGMEHLCKFEDATAQFLKRSQPLRNEDSIPPEEQEDSKSSTAPQYGHARDAYAFGILAQNMLEYLTDLGSMSATFEQRINEEFLDDDPTVRPKLNTLLKDQLFKNDFLEITNFLVHLTVKPEAAKNAFFEGLAPRLHRLPRQLVANRLTPLLLSSFVMAEPMAVSAVLPHFMTPVRESNSKRREFLTDQINPLFSEDLYKQFVIPVIIRLFPSREMHVRICLLQYFSFYAHLFDVNILRKGVLPQLLIGLKDCQDELVAASLKALAEIVPILGAQLVVGGERIKYFVEGRPKFFSKKETPLKNMDNVTNLTAVSGVITLPSLDKTPPTKPPLPPYTDGTPSDTVDETGVAGQDEEEAAAVARRRQQERERRREELKAKNEQRRREREAKRNQGSGKVTLLSMTDLRKDPVESAGDVPLDETSPRFEKISFPDDVEDKLEELELEEASKSEDDWSDWDDVSQPESFFSPDPEANQSGVVLHARGDQQEPVGTSADAQVDSDWSRVNDDWGQTNMADEKGHASSKKTAKPLQLKKQTVAKESAEPKTETPKPATKPGNAKTFPKKQLRTTPKSTELGSEFLIPDIVATPKVKSPELDFFADMEPSFSFTPSSKTTDNKKGKTASQSPKEDETKLSFTMNNPSTDMESGDGWGMEDDFNWDDTES
ncbi:protein-associating with the carboxyl-terminal domain of ezrin-like [Asterias amurensis]|uniref:protein-associating with the carboxyl-terminal domain of ezrin-like n=1 Tax=Asterias amurensis TaxID=7602 RepID=UPI003AB4004E